MKAIYQKPATGVFTIATTELMAGSLLQQQTDGTIKQELDGSTPNTDLSSGNLSRRRTVWDDEEEEEDF
jgi:hypothetical protein